MPAELVSHLARELRHVEIDAAHSVYIIAWVFSDSFNAGASCYLKSYVVFIRIMISAKIILLKSSDCRGLLEIQGNAT